MTLAIVFTCATRFRAAACSSAIRIILVVTRFSNRKRRKAIRARIDKSRQLDVDEFLGVIRPLMDHLAHERGINKPKGPLGQEHARSHKI